ncbi:LLM class flavin-dependent oxidoreductase [Agrobacterium rhizogenes]|nr:LLM class flavin-dependent oxidoreductase [Rhizobium rhizogenes]NTG32207.1 LLM class flavin-dependent oxidoreductase [Rhizobium rhizogenes]
MTEKKQIHLAAFMNAGPQGTVGWRHPEAATDFLSASYYIRIARLLEDARFDLAFIPDALAMPRSLGGNFNPAVQWGSGTPRLDPLTVLGVMAGATSRIGLAATVSTGYHEPYNVARSFATLDHLTGGRTGWNVVTSFQDAEARNFGEDRLPPRDERYAKAEEFIEVTAKLWDSWADDTIIADKESGQFGRPETVRAVDHQGRFFKVQGPLGAPRPPQGYPVIVQAGSSEAGRGFASRWADVIFCSHESIESARDFYRDIKRRAVQQGRNPNDILILPAASVVVGETRAAAEAKHKAFVDLVSPEAGLSRLSYHVNVDLSKYDLDQPMPSLDEVGVEGHYKEVLEFAEREKLSLREIGKWYGARTEGGMVGSPTDVVDRMEHWVNEGAADGFTIVGVHLPSSFQEFADLVIPELRRRGLVRADYTGVTLRENLGLPRPARDEWRNRRLKNGGYE